MKSLLGLIALLTSCCANAWDEDPRIEEHNLRTSHLIKLGDKQVREGDPEAKKLLNLMVEERQKIKEKKND